MNLRKLVRKAIRRHNWAIGRLEYNGHQGYKCPTDLYSAKIASGDLRVELYEDSVYRFYNQTEVFVNGESIAVATYSFNNLPIDVEALFVPQLIIDLVNGVDLDAALKKYRQDCDTIAVEDLAAAGLLGELGTYYGSRN